MRTRIRTEPVRAFSRASLPVFAAWAALAGLSVSGVAQAQGGEVVSPMHFAHQEGSVNSNNPLGLSDTRYLQVHDDLAGTARTIRGVALRRNGNSRDPFPAYSITLSMFCSTATSSASAPVADFDANHGADKITVVDNRTIDFPATTQSPRLPQPFDYQIQFDTPFDYGGQGPLAWEIQVHASTHTRGQVFHDAVASSALNPPNVHVPFGSGCRAAGRQSGLVTFAQGRPDWVNGNQQSSLDLTCQGALPDGMAMFNIGTSHTGWNGLALPFLIPGSGQNASGPCHVYNDAVVTVMAPTDGFGTARVRLPVLYQTGFAGLNAFCQSAALDPSAALSVVTGNAVNVHVVAPFPAVPVGRVFLNRGRPFAQGNNGLVVRFDG